MTRRLTKSAVALLAFAVMIGFAPPALAAALETSWWTRSPLATAPDGGMAVSVAPDGPVSVGAFAVDLDRGVDRLTVAVPVVDAVNDGAAVVSICAVPPGWAASAGGALADAPATACGGLQVQAGLDDGTLQADLTSLVSDATGITGFAVVPSAGQVGPWDLVLGTPEVAVTFRSVEAAERVESDERPAPVDSAGPAATPPPPSTEPAPSPAPVIATSPPTTAPPSVPPAAPSAAGTTPGPVESATPFVTPDLLDAVDAGDGRPVQQALFFVALSTVVGLAAGYGHKVVSDRSPG